MIDHNTINIELRSHRLVLRSSGNRNKSSLSISDIDLPKKNIMTLVELTIALKESDRIIGTCGLIKKKESDEIRCYYALLPEFQGNGYAIEALRLLFDYAFNSLNLTRIKADVPDGNIRAWKVAERSGMTYYGNIKNKSYSKQIMVFSITRDNFKNQIG